MAGDAAGRQGRGRFTWAAVDPPLIRAMLAATSDDRGDLDLVDDDDQLRRWADTRLRTPLALQVVERHPDVGRVLREWFETHAPDEVVCEVADAVWRTARAGGTRPSGPESCRTFLAGRRWASTYRHEVRRAFLRRHRAPGEPIVERPEGVRRNGVRLLQGLDAVRSRQAWRHQQDAWRALDALDGDRRGLVVLPTGAGKTDTMVRWLVGRMTAEPDLRVLWLAHQQELLEQAADRFQAEARHAPSGFQRSLRVVASHADRATTLAAGDAHVVVSTWQSLRSQWERRERVLRDFLRRGPCAVVVDEAHRASADGYQALLDLAVEHGGDVVLGLTATPWPRSVGAAVRLRAAFPVDVIRVSPEELHADGVLARPTVHRVDTGEVVRLTEVETRQLGEDLPAAVLGRLAVASRDEFVVRHWSAQPSTWGKTLVFATGKDHADRLAERFREDGHTAWSLHSSSAAPRAQVLTQFREHRGPGVLVSVGMLTEGVDVPDARTAFLARPTASPVLMRQMIGRVLRGPQAGGTAEAHIVHFRDDWAGFEEILDPEDVVEGPAAPPEPPSGPCPPLIADDGRTIDPAVVRELEGRLRQGGVAARLLPTAGFDLAGYYDLGVRKVGVLAGQDRVWEEVLTQTLDGASWRGRSLEGLFDDVPAGPPSPRAIRDVLEFTRAAQERPRFVPITLSVDATAIAREVEDLVVNERERRAWFDRRFAEVGHVAFPSVQHMIEAVGDALGELHRTRHGERTGTNPEVGRVSPAPKPPMPRDPQRRLPEIADVAERMRHLVDDEVAARLDRVDLPSLSWTRQVVTSTFAHYTRRRKDTDFVSSIKVNRNLQAPADVVPDEALEYLVFHELLHHVLPGRGHDAEFRRLEGLWPGADRLDAELDTLGERYHLGPGTI